MICRQLMMRVTTRWFRSSGMCCHAKELFGSANILAVAKMFIVKIKFKKVKRLIKILIN